MATVDEIQRQEVWKFRHAPPGSSDEKIRPCVVIDRAEGDYFTVVYGGSQGHPGAEHVLVEESDDIKAMGLDHKTYFRHNSVLVVHVDEFKRKIGRCPDLPLFVEIETIAFDFEKRYGKPIPKQ